MLSCFGNHYVGEAQPEVEDPSSNAQPRKGETQNSSPFMRSRLACVRPFSSSKVVRRDGVDVIGVVLGFRVPGGGGVLHPKP